jgi:hypothetical protein
MLPSAAESICAGLLVVAHPAADAGRMSVQVSSM